jgi:hypothetical protein
MVFVAGEIPEIKENNINIRKQDVKICYGHKIKTNRQPLLPLVSRNFVSKMR